MSVRLKLEDTREGLVATISQRGDDGKITGVLRFFWLGGRKRQSKKQTQSREPWG